jgi:ribonuclease VapC
LEAAIVVETRRGPAGAEKLDQFLKSARVQVAPVTEEQAVIARLAFRVYGKGRHPAALNFGDCFAYALAQSTSEPLLFKGGDFAQTDVKKALV